MIRYILFSLFFLFFALKARGDDFIQEIGSLQGKTTADFLREFTFDAYLDKVSLEDIKQIESHRLHLNSKGLDGDAFIRKIAENYSKRIRLDFNQFDTIKHYLLVADVWSHSKFFLPDSVKVYQRWSDLFFNTISDTLSMLLEKGYVNKNQFQVSYVLEKLKENQYMPVVPVNNAEKLFDYLIEGRFGYIWQKCLTTYRNQFIVFCLFALFFAVTYVWFVFSFFGRLRKRKTNG